MEHADAGIGGTEVCLHWWKLQSKLILTLHYNIIIVVKANAVVLKTFYHNYDGVFCFYLFGKFGLIVWSNVNQCIDAGMTKSTVDISYMYTVSTFHTTLFLRLMLCIKVWLPDKKMKIDPVVKYVLLGVYSAWLYKSIVVFIWWAFRFDVEQVSVLVSILKWPCHSSEVL